MIDKFIEALFTVVLAAWGVSALLAARRRSRSTHADLLEPVLAAHGLELMSVDIPPRFVTGPFPRGVTESHGKVNFLWHSDWQYRHLTVVNGLGDEHEVWARLFFVNRKNGLEIDWQPDLESIGVEQSHEECLHLVT